MNYFREKDIRILFFINNRLHKKSLKGFFTAYTELGGVVFYSFLIIGLLVVNKPVGIELLVNIFISQFIVHSIKFLVHRPRPYKTYEEVIVRKESKDINSFPSAHTASSLMAALTFSHLYPELTLAFLAAAVLVGLSRIYLGYHYPSDVLGSMGITLLTYVVIGLVDVL